MGKVLVVKDGEMVEEVIEEVIDDKVIDDKVVDDKVVDNKVVDDDVVVDDDNPDTLGEPEWMKEDVDDQDTSDVMPVSAHIRAKRKLKGKIGDRDSEIEKLRQEIEDLKKAKFVQPKDKVLARPRETDFETLEEYYKALDKYEDERIESKLSVVQGQRSVKETQTQAIKALEDAVESHYERASKLIKENGISADTYRQTDEVLRNSIEAVKPGLGDIIVDQMISILGKGSEKVMYMLGRNKAIRGELITLLTEDSTGLKATAFIGEQKAKILSTTKRKSNAPVPASELSGGDGAISGKERVYKKKYSEAHSKGNSQAAYNAKKAARTAGIDTSSW